MKKSLLTIALSLIFMIGFSQSRKLTLKDFKTWTVQGNLNSNFGNGDIINSTPFYSKTNMNFGYGLRVNKFFSNNFGIAVDLYKSKLSGEEGNWSYESEINYQPSILLIAQTGNIRYFDELKKFQLYGYVGYGMLNYSSEATNSVWANQNASYEGNYQIIPMGLGIKYHVANDLTANIEYSFNNVNGDKLDGYNNGLTDYDNYSRFSIGISYAIGKSIHRELEWHDPRPNPTPYVNRKDTVVIIQQTPVIDSNLLKSLTTREDVTPSSLLADSIFIDSLNLTNAKATVYYEFNEYKLPMLYHYKLQTIGFEAINKKGSRIIIESFTDTIGSDKNNLIVVQRRSKEIYNYLNKIGVPKNIIDIKLHDRTDAIMPTDAENRKSIIYIVK